VRIENDKHLANEEFCTSGMGTPISLQFKAE
jgi:hypothetical protein